MRDLQKGYEIDWECPVGRMLTGTVHLIEGDLVRVKLQTGSPRWVRRSSIKEIRKPETCSVCLKRFMVSVLSNPEIPVCPECESGDISLF